MIDQSAPEISPGRRAASYWFLDGLQEIVSGIEFAILGCAMGGLWLGRHAPFRWVLLSVGLGIIALLVVLLLGGDRKVIGFLKARVTYPRTGYVRPPMSADEAMRTEGARKPDAFLNVLTLAPPIPADENITGFANWTVTCLIADIYLFQTMYWVLGPRTLGLELPAALSGLAMAMYAFSRSGERRYPWWSLLLLPLAGFLPVGLRVPVRLQTCAVPLVFGVWLAAQGVWALFRYIRANPRPPSGRGLCV